MSGSQTCENNPDAAMSLDSESDPWSLNLETQASGHAQHRNIQTQVKFSLGWAPSSISRNMAWLHVCGMGVRAIFVCRLR